MGAWIEICVSITLKAINLSRTPRWVRGLKLLQWAVLLSLVLSHPTMGAWIEMLMKYVDDAKETVAPHDGCVD